MLQGNQSKTKCRVKVAHPYSCLATYLSLRNRRCWPRWRNLSETTGIWMLFFHVLSCFLRSFLCRFWPRNAGVAPSNFTLSILIKLYGRCGDLKAAFGVVEEYPKRFKFRLNAQVYTCLMSTCIWSGDLPMAFDVYQTMLQDGCLADGKTFDTLLMGCLKHQDARRALQVVREAAEFGVSVNPEMLESAVLMVREYGPELGQSCHPRSKKWLGPLPS